MRVLVTGGTGFIGAHLIHALTGRDHDVISLSRRMEIPPSVSRHYVWDVVDAVPDITDDIDAIVHLAGAPDASSSFAHPVSHGRINALGTLHLLELARQRDAVFIVASTQRVYQPHCAPIAEDALTRPVDPYGYSKLVAEQWVRMYHELYGLRTSVVRLFSVYGPGQVITGGSSGVVAIFAARALRGEPLHVASSGLRDFTYVSDVARGVTLALENLAADGQTYNIATGEGTSIAVLAETIKEIVGSSSSIQAEDGDDRTGYVADITKARRELGYEPQVGLREGLQRYVEHLRRAAQDPA